MCIFLFYPSTSSFLLIILLIIFAIVVSDRFDRSICSRFRNKIFWTRRNAARNHATTICVNCLGWKELEFYANVHCRGNVEVITAQCISPAIKLKNFAINFPPYFVVIFNLHHKMIFYKRKKKEKDLIHRVTNIILSLPRQLRTPTNKLIARSQLVRIVLSKSFPLSGKWTMWNNKNDDNDKNNAPIPIPGIYSLVGTFTTPCINSTKSTVLATKFVNAHNNTNTGAQRVPQCGTANLTNLMKYLNKSGRMYGGCACAVKIRIIVWKIKRISVFRNRIFNGIQILFIISYYNFAGKLTFTNCRWKERRVQL